MQKYDFHIGDKLGPYGIQLVNYGYKENGSLDKWHYLFKCPWCGALFVSSIYTVQSGHCTSCGCKQKEQIRALGKSKKYNLVNKKFGKLTVVEDTGKRTKGKNVVWKCLCDCGQYCEVSSHELLTGQTQSCGCMRSHGENKIASILDDLNIEYIREKMFKDCINPLTKKKLRFDFYLPEYNCCIEYDGIQHYKVTGWQSKELLEKTQNRDNVKNKYCFDNGIKLIRIKYLDYNNLTANFLMQRILQ